MGKIAFVFAGQGSQFPGMGKELYESFDSAKRIFDKAESIRSNTINQCFEGPISELNITINTQPCLFAMDLACARVLNEKGVYADGVAGFSLGEIPAVAYAGILSEEEAFKFVCVRAELMQQCAEANKGVMLAVLKLSENQVEEICNSFEKAYPVNYNCPGQTVVACAEETADNLSKAIFAAGGKLVKLAVSGAFHSPYMDNASNVAYKYLENKRFNEQSIPIYANATANNYDNPKELLSKQVNHPVLWQKTIENMIVDGFDTFIEVGAGKTLSGLISKISKDVSVFNVGDNQSLMVTITGLGR